MTELTITPRVSDKTARFRGTVAAGEHVAVTIKGGAEWMGEDDGANLMLRVLDLVTGRTLAVFPRPAETLEEGETPDAWSEATEDADDLYCELNLNTTRMVAAARHMLRVPVLFVLGDTDDPRTLYFRDRYEIEYWPERIGDTAPYDLDKWPKQIDEWSEQVAQFGEALAGHVGDAVAHVTATERATWNSKYAKPVSGIPANDLAEGVRSAIAAVPNKADKAATYTKTEVDALVSGAASGVFVVADSLPATGEANKIYLVPNGSGAAGNVRDEYMWVNSAWELIGSTQVDLSNYYDKTAADGRFVQKEVGKGLFSGSYNDLTDKPTIPAPVTIDPSLSLTSENPVQNKAVAAALAARLDGAAAYPAWDADVSYAEGGIVFHRGRLWRAMLQTRGVEPGTPEGDSDWSSDEYVTIDVLKQDALSSAQMAAVNSGATAAKVATWDGYAAQIAAKANTADVAAALALKANAADLSYAMVTPGEWEFSGDLTGFTGLSVYYNPDMGKWLLDFEYEGIPGQSDGVSGDGNELSVTFIRADESWHITATRASLPGHLLDRANNLIDATTGNVTLTLPPFEAGKVRDLLVHVNLGDDGTGPYTVTVNFPSGETNTGFKVKGNASAPLPAPDAAGEWLFSFSECAPHKMAVSLAQLQDVTVAGGS